MSNIWQVRTAITGGSGAAQVSTMFFDQAAGLTAQGAADAVHAFWDTLKTKIVNSYTFDVEPVVEDIDTATGSPTGLTAVTVASVSGTLVGDPNPWATQGLVSWRTGVFLAGREAGVPQASYVAALNSAAATLATDPNSSLCIYSRKKRAIGVVSTGQAWTKWAILRSRRD